MLGYWRHTVIDQLWSAYEVASIACVTQLYCGLDVEHVVVETCAHAGIPHTQIDLYVILWLRKQAQIRVLVIG
jgi:hypothetical protein